MSSSFFQDKLKEFLVEQPDIDGDASTAEGLQPFDLDSNVELLEEQSSGDMEAVDKAVSKVADSRKWSFHKDLLLSYLTQQGDTMTLEGRVLVGIVARQILVRSKAEDPPNKAVAQELFVKLKGDSDKSNSIALYVTSKWPQQFFEEIQAKISSQPNKDLRIHVLKVGFGFVENSFVIDTAKKVDLLKSRNLPWADFSQKVFQWAYENIAKGTSAILQAAESTKLHLEKIGAAFSSGDSAVSSRKSSNTSNEKEEHVLKDEEELKRIEAEKSKERREAMRSKMRRGSNSAANRAPSPVTAVANALHVPAAAVPRPSRPTAASDTTSGISYLSAGSAGQGFSAASYPPQSYSTQTSATTSTTGISFPSSTGVQQGYNSTTSYPNTSTSSPTVPYDYSGADQSRWGRQDQNQEPQNQGYDIASRPQVYVDPSWPAAVPKIDTVKPGLDELRAQRPSLRDDEARQFASNLPPANYSRRPSRDNNAAGLFVADVGNDHIVQPNTARPGHDERVSMRPSLNHDSTYASQEYRAAGPQHYGTSSGYNEHGDFIDSGRTPVAPSAFPNGSQASSYPPRDNGNKRSRGGGNGYERNTRQRSESPSFGGGRGIGRGMDMTKPAWMTEAGGQASSGPVGGYNTLGSSSGAAFADADAMDGGGRGRGRHQTAPAWMTRDHQDSNSGGVNGPPPTHQHSTPVPSGGGGRGRHQTQPAWMTQQQGGGGPTGRPGDSIGSMGEGAGRGRGRGLTLPAWVTQQQQQQQP